MVSKNTGTATTATTQPHAGHLTYARTHAALPAVSCPAGPTAALGGSATTAPAPGCELALITEETLTDLQLCC